MRPTSRRPWWQQVTALVSVSAGGAITGFAFVPKAAAEATPTGMPVRLLALDQQRQGASSASEAMLRSAVVNVASYYLRMAQTKTPAEMEAIIWQHDSLDGTDHGESCAAFASLTLELGAQAVGQHSWVTGGTSYPWPLHDWADVRVDPNASSLGITSILQDAQAHQRWHPAGDGYQPQPGDWVLFENHVEVVTGYSHGVLHTIGGDSLPNFSVNAHEYADPLSGQGVTGFVDNGLRPTGTPPETGRPPGHPRKAPRQRDGRQPSLSGARVPGVLQPPQPPAAVKTPATASGSEPAIPGVVPAQVARPAGAARQAVPDQEAYRRHDPGSVPPLRETAAQEAFISAVAPGAITAEHRYGVPASVTIAQAIDESGWGLSSLASRDHNLFGIKGTGPAGSDPLPTGEYLGGKLVTVVSPFRVYHNIAQSIDDHGRLLADSGFYSKAMAHSTDPNAFAAALTGVYATAPDYGSKIITIMQRYDLYRYDGGTPPATAAPAAPPAPAAQQPAAASPPPAASPTPPPTSAASPRSVASRPAQIPGVLPSASQQATVIPPPSPAPVTTSRPPASTPRQAPPRQAQPRQTPRRRSRPGEAMLAGGADIPGLRNAPGSTAAASTAVPSTAAAAPQQPTGQPSPDPVTLTSWSRPTRPAARQRRRPQLSRPDAPRASRYHPQIPPAVRTAFTAMARVPLLREEQLYRDVAGEAGIRWELLAACDWLQCEAHPRYSPVHGEKLGTVNADGTVYRTKSAALAQCAEDLTELAEAVYGISLTPRPGLSVRELASVFAAFRWGALLKQHHTSAMEFPYSVAGLTTQHLRMRWPSIDVPTAPDKPGARFRMPFGAVPIVLCLKYPATV